MTSLKIYLQQSHRFQDFFHSDKSAKEQAMLVNAQRYKAKQVLRQNSTMLIKLLIFYFLCGFWIFDVDFGFLTHKNEKIHQKQY